MSVLDQFLSGISESLQSKNGSRIAELIHLDVERLPPDRRLPYEQLNQQLKQQYPKGQDGRLDGRLLDRCNQCVTALGDSKYGVIMIPIVLSFSRTLAFIASYLDRNPSVLKSQQSNLPSVDESSSTGGKVSFLEDTANVLRDAFIKCLAGSPGVLRTTKPNDDDKRIGIYLTANATLKLLFQARKLRNAQQMFLSIDAQSPPLSFYPFAQRVTYLYYLGRYHFANNHFLRAATALQQAYHWCHSRATTHRRHILTYLIASNLCLGNFPSQKLLIRPDANPLAKYFLPLMNTIKSGDIGAFEAYLSLSSPTSTWFLRRRILLQLRNRCEVLVWRSLIRKCFILKGFHGGDKKMPFLRVHIVQEAARFSLARAKEKTNSQAFASNLNGNNTNGTDGTNYIDPEFRAIHAAELETGFDLESGTYTSTDQINTNNSFTDYFPPPPQSPTTTEIISIFLSLIQQGFLRGFITRQPGNIGQSRFAIRGSKNEGPVVAGFPGIYGVVVANNVDEGLCRDGLRRRVLGLVEVVGDEDGRWGWSRGRGSLAGRTVRLSGARPVGAG